MPKDNISYPEHQTGLYIYLAYSFYMFFTIIGTWRSATKYTLNKKQNKISGAYWGTISKVWLTIAVFNQLFVFLHETGHADRLEVSRLLFQEDWQCGLGVREKR